MTITYLEPGREASCVTGEVTVRALPAPGHGDFRLVVTRPGGGAYDGPAYPRPDRIVLPVLTGRVEIAVMTTQPEALFGPDARFRMLVDVVTADGGFDQVQSPEVDLSGLRGGTLLWIDAVGKGSLSVGSVGSAGSPSSTGSTSSPALAGFEAEPVPVTSPLLSKESAAHAGPDNALIRRARTESRALVGAARAPVAELRDYTVVLDRSASMAAHSRSGAVAAVLNSIAGIAQVFGAEAALPVWSGGPWSAEQSADLASDSPDEVVARVYQAPVIGFSIAPMLPLLPASGPGTVFVLSDDYPADLPDLTDAELAGSNAERRWHLVVFGRSRHDFRYFGTGAPQPPKQITDDVSAVESRDGVLLTSVAVDEREPINQELEQIRGMRAMVRALARGSTR
jgi:hypothetical protein